ncbi:hypothetical protein FQN57_001909 [Myotisia sp. PD_48]|nr:hypothetical protein FQN57_001909 [Myotisia sp. PD_48]
MSQRKNPGLDPTLMMYLQPTNDKIPPRQRKGQEHYVNQEYKEALLLFTKANSGVGNLIGLLDNRAATLIKLKDLDSALRDGRRMIKADKTDSRGYLRTAKILQLMDRRQDALRLYEYALASVNKDDQNYPQIELLRYKLNRVLHPPRRMDPSTTLPPELMEFVFQHLNLVDVLSAVRVSKRWHSLVSVFGNWSHLDLSLSRKSEPPLQAVRAYLRRSGITIRKVTMNEKSSSAHVKKILSLVSNCPKLTHIVINSHTSHWPEFTKFANLKALNLVQCLDLGFQELYSLLHGCPGLELLHVSIYGRDVPDMDNPHMFPFFISQLRYFHIYLPCLVDIKALNMARLINERMPYLETLKLGGKTGGLDGLLDLADHAHLQEFSSGLLQIPELHLPPRIKNIGLGARTCTTLAGKPSLVGLNDLKTAKFHDCRVLSPHMLSKYFRSADIKLTTLHFCFSSCLTGIDFINLMKKGYFMSIVDLGIVACEDVSDPVVDTILHTMPNLKQLDLSYSAITSLSVINLANSEEPKLESLDLHQMKCRIDKDALEYARDRGITIPTPLHNYVTEHYKFRVS